MSQSWRQKYFVKMGDGDYKVNDKVRSYITFKIFNLMEPFRFSKPFEIIFCRNVMIYFEKQRKDELVQKYCNWLIRGGYFFVSHSENVGHEQTGFRMLRPSIFRREA